MASKARAEPVFVVGTGIADALTCVGKTKFIPYRRVKGDYCGIGLGSFVTCRRRPSVVSMSIAVDRLVYSRAGGEQ